VKLSQKKTRIGQTIIKIWNAVTTEFQNLTQSLNKTHYCKFEWHMKMNILSSCLHTAETFNKGK